MSAPLIVSIDVGTQSIRALAFDRSGALLDKSQVALDGYTHPQAGWMEHEAEGFYALACTALKRLWEQGIVDPTEVKGLVLTTQRATVIPLNEAGQPLRPAIIWPDQRRAELRNARPLVWRMLFTILGLKPTIDALERDCEINWLQQNEPQLWAETRHYLLLSGYLNFKLTGHVCDSVGNQVGFIPFDYKTQTWCKPGDWKWHAMPVSPEQLPTLYPIGSVMGELSEAVAEDTGLSVGTQVIAGAADKACEVLGSGCTDPTMAHISCGTTATINVCTERYLEPRPFIPPYPAAIPDFYNGEIQIYRGFWMVSWFKEQFGQLEIERAQQEGVTAETLFEEFLVNTPPGSDGLILQPFWNPGLGEPGPEARGSIIGFTDTHTRAHVYRAIIEGLGFALRAGRDQLEKRTKIKIESIRVSGGGAQSDAVMQILADILQVPTERPSHVEASGLGAAILGYVALGQHSNAIEASKAMTGNGRRFEPNPKLAKRYGELFEQVYSKQYGRLKPLFETITALWQSSKDST
jgi:sugar (pentulose or hexulose) kinase